VPLSVSNVEQRGTPGSHVESRSNSWWNGLRFSYRQVVASLGLVAVVVAELLRPGALQKVLSGVGWFGLLVAAVTLLLE